MTTIGSNQSGNTSISRVELAIYAGAIVVAAAIYGSIYFKRAPTPTAPQVFEPLTGVAEPLTNQLAVLDIRHQLWLVDPTTGHRERLTRDGEYCELPSWSPDDAYLAYINGASEGRHGINIISPSNHTEYQVLKPQGFNPYFLNWSPDGHFLAYSASFGERVRFCAVLGLVDKSPSFELSRGPSVYWQWSPDSRSILWNQSGELNLTTVKNWDRKKKLTPSFDAFTTPAWGKETGSFVYARGAEGPPSLILGRDPGQSGRYLYTADFRLTMTTSRDRARLAILEMQRKPRSRVPGPIAIVSLDEERPTVHFPIEAYAFFWSPNHRYLAALTRHVDPDPNRTAIHSLVPPDTVEASQACWWILDTETGDMTPLIQFVPTHNFMGAANRVSQIQSAHNIWSPDGTQIVLGALEADRHTSTIWLVAVSGEEAPRSLGDGSIATWTWH